MRWAPLSRSCGAGSSPHCCRPPLRENWQLKSGFGQRHTGAASGMAAPRRRLP